jgi:nitrate/TMAO reductase-like tetraheme cytochrome c subunit
MPYGLLGVLTLAALVASAYAWDYTNSPQFCGTVCHTMPPEFTAYLTSPHARIDCVECHIGRGFIAQRVTRKAGDVKHIVSLAFKNYEFPIRAEDLRPARETCERCHFPAKFSDDSLREIKEFRSDPNNTPISIYLTLKTGGGSKRLGLGRGIHWHIENTVQYLPLDPEEQEIPYVRVVQVDGSTVEYLDVQSDLTPDQIDDADLEVMDCITCHNRITHLISTPEETVDELMARGVISPTIPEIHRKAIEVYGANYPSMQYALNGIAGLRGYYTQFYPEFFASNQELVVGAVTALQEAYEDSVFPEQKADWTTHPNNVGHEDSPGCFRCHDGQHLNAAGEAVRLECNLCHSIPVVAGPDDFVADIEISRGPEPSSHVNPNWIVLHREALDASCSNCHTTGDPGGVSNTTFCSNSACHGRAWDYAGFDAPQLRQALANQMPTPQPEGTPIGAGPLTYTETIGPMLQSRCGACHGDGGMRGLNMTEYSTLLAGGVSGPVILPGDPDNSLIIAKISGEEPHFAQLTLEELKLLRDWISAGAPE